MVRISSWWWLISPTPTLRLPARGWSWSMYSNRRSARRPGSVQTPCTFQLVFTMQKAVPHEAAASVAALNASAASSGFFISFSLPECDDTHGAQGRAHSAFTVNQAREGGARGRFGVNRGEGRAGASRSVNRSATRDGREETMPRTASAGFPLPSHSDKLSQAQTWPEPGGQTGDQDWSKDPAAAAFSP
jgi:hypothetical protein